MEGRIQNFCDATIGAQILAWKHLMETPVSEALLKKEGYGKVDTLGLDAIPEIMESKYIENYNKEAILVTEETDKYTKKLWPLDHNLILQLLIFVSDPLDRTKYYELFIDKLRESENNEHVKVGDLIKRKDAAKVWEEDINAGKPAMITGATTSLTCIFRNKIVCSVIINLVTDTIFIASPAGIHYMKLPDFNDNKVTDIDFNYIIAHGKRLEFLSALDTCKCREDKLKFVTYLGSERKRGYLENFEDSMLFIENPLDYAHHKEPGGPSRTLYLSQFQKKHGPIGIVMSNGEKISEWIAWLAFVKYAKDKKGEPALKAFEIFVKDKPHQKEGILMSTSSAYSIFEIGENNEDSFLDISLLRKFENKSHFRSMLVVIANDNDTVIRKMIENGYREISRAL